MRWLVLAPLLFACSSSSSSSGPGAASCPPSANLGECSEQGLECSYDDGGRERVCTCDGFRFSCSTCGDLSACTPGESCSFSDWERDCDCGCTPHGHWSCTGLYPNYGCPTDSTYQDAGVDGMP